MRPDDNAREDPMDSVDFMEMNALYDEEQKQNDLYDIMEKKYQEYFAPLREPWDGPDIDTPSHDEAINQILRDFFENAKNGVQFEEAKEKAMLRLIPYLKINCNWEDKKDCVRDILKLIFIPKGELSTLMWIAKEPMALSDKELMRYFKVSRYIIGKRAKDVEKYLRAKKPGKNLL